MYGTVARMRVKPGMSEQIQALGDEYAELRESYRRNAEDPAQDQRYRKMAELLIAAPEWHDGEVVSVSSQDGPQG